MKTSSNLARNFLLGFFGLGLAVVAYQSFPSAGSSNPVGFVQPALSAAAREGEALYEGTCAACHGRNALGTDKGPPFIHDIYNPGHHGDDAFRRAARYGVQQHHWPFGDMRPQPGVGDADVAKIIAYVRELQAANGIKYRPHVM